jgi:hypothetical protein
MSPIGNRPFLLGLLPCLPITQESKDMTLDTLTKSAIKQDAFRMAYRVALAWQYKENNPETFGEYRFSDGTWLKHYLNAAA